MRQAGIIAAGALFALRNHLPDIEASHRAAETIARALIRAGASVELPETNIVNVKVPSNAQAIVESAKHQGVLLHAMSPKLVRIVTHRDLSQEQVVRGTNLLLPVLEQHRALCGKAVP
jgi:threonine aldolase